MIRHKFLFKISYDEVLQVFEELNNKHYIANEYDYYSPKKAQIGYVFKAQTHGTTFISIATNYLTRWRFCGRTKIYRLMYALTDKGFDYLKEILLILKI